MSSALFSPDQITFHGTGLAMADDTLCVSDVRGVGADTGWRAAAGGAARRRNGAAGFGAFGEFLPGSNRVGR